MSALTSRWKRWSNGTGGNNCVEVRQLDDSIEVRDSKWPTGPRLGFTPAEWRSFVEGVKRGEFDIV